MRNKLNEFWYNVEGQFSIILAIMAMVLLLGAAIASDISDAHTQRQKLQDAVDISTLAGASYATHQNSPGNGQIKSHAEKAFLDNCSAKICAGVTPKIKINNNRIIVTAANQLDPLMMTIFGKGNIDISAESEAEFGGQSVNYHVDVYFIVDVSTSMSIADGLSEMSALMANYKPASNPVNGCAFACHEIYPGDAQTGDQIADSLGIHTRNDRVKKEIRRISEEIIYKSNGKSHISIMTFAGDLKGHQADQVTSKMAINTALSDIDYAVWGSNMAWALPQAWAKLPSSGGNGSVAKPKVIAVLVTDGVFNSKTAAGVDQVRAMNPAVCQEIKDRGIEMFVMNVEYPEPSLFKYNGQTVTMVNAIYDDIKPALIACASPGRYFEGQFNTSVTKAFDEILDGVTEDYENTVTRLIR